MKTMIKVIISALLFMSTANAETVIKVGAGGVPLQNIFSKVKDAFEKTNPGIKLDLKKIEPVTGLQGLDKEEFDVVSVGLALKDWMGVASKGGYAVKDQAAYSYKIIGRDSLIVVVSKDTNIKKIETAKLIDLFSGKVTNWKQIGGADLPVTWIHGSNTPGMDSRVKKNLSLENLKAGKESSVESKDIGDTVAKTAGSIAYGPKALSLNTNLIELELDIDFSSPVTALTKGEPKPEIKKLYDFIAGEGAKLVVK